jgi:hypothetical protein
VILAVFDVLGVPHLQWPMVYARLGYIPLSVLAAFAVPAVSVLLAEVRVRRRTKDNSIMKAATGHS